VSPRLRRRRKARLRGPDLHQFLTDREVHERGFASVGVHVEIHLFSCSNENVVPTPMQGVEQVHSFVIDGEEPRQHIERLEHFRFGPVSNMRFDRIQSTPGLAIRIIHTNRAEQRIGCVPKHLQIAGVGHVAVVVDPLRPDLRFDEPQRLPSGTARSGATTHRVDCDARLTRILRG